MYIFISGCGEQQSREIQGIILMGTEHVLSHLTSRATKMKTYNTFIIPVTTCGSLHEKWNLSMNGARELRSCKRKIIYGPVFKENTWRICPYSESEEILIKDCVGWDMSREWLMDACQRHFIGSEWKEGGSSKVKYMARRSGDGSA